MMRIHEQCFSHMPPHEAEVFLLQHGILGLIRFDEQIVPQAGVDAIDPALRERFLRGELPSIVQLKKLYLIAEDENKQLCLMRRIVRVQLTSKFSVRSTSSSAICGWKR